MKNSLALRVWRSHAFLVKLGPKVGGGIIKLTAYFALYKVFTSGGAEALAYMAYENLLHHGKAEQEQLTREKRQHGRPQGNVQKEKRP